MSVAKTLRQLLSGTSDAAIRFDDVCSLLESLGFDQRVKGRRRGENQFAAGRQQRQAVPGKAGAGGHLEIQAG